MRTKKYLHRISILLVVISVMQAFSVWGKPAKKKIRKTPVAKTAVAESSKNDEEFKAFIADLHSSDPEKVIVAVQMLGLSENPAASEHLIALLKTGPGNDITNLALQTLGVLKNPNAIDTLIKYLNHRRSDARTAALSALIEFNSPKIKNALEQKLRDSNPEVRTRAALALGTKGDASSVSVLFKAFERGVNEAAISIGKLGSGKDALHLTEYLGKLDISTLLPGLREYLLGKQPDDQTRLQVLNILFDFAGPEVRQFAIQLLEDIKAARPEMEYDDPILKLLHKMVNQIAKE